MTAPAQIFAWIAPKRHKDEPTRGGWNTDPEMLNVAYIRADLVSIPTITAYREALRLLGVDPDSIAREAEKEAQNG